jgi:hypothetical protein
MAFLAAKPFHLSDGHAVDSNLGERFLNLLEFEGLDDGNNELHDEKVAAAEHCLLSFVSSVPVFLAAQQRLLACLAGEGRLTLSKPEGELASAAGSHGIGL